MYNLHLGTKVIGNSFNRYNTIINEYISFDDIKNISITGITGSGMTYFLKHLLSQSYKFNARNIILDGNFQSYAKNHDNHPEWNINDIDILDLRYDGKHFIDLLAPLYHNESNNNIAKRVTEIISYKSQFGYKMKKYLYDTILFVLNNNGRDKDNIYKVIDILKADKNQSSQRVYRRLEYGLKYDYPYFNPKDKENINWIFDKPGTTVIRFPDHYDSIQIDPILISIIFDMIKYGYKDTKIPVIIALDNYYRYSGDDCKNIIISFLNSLCNNIYIWIAGSEYDSKPIYKYLNPLCFNNNHLDRGYFEYIHPITKEYHCIHV